MKEINSEKIAQYLSFAHFLADEARKITTAYFRQPLDIISKEDTSPVTVADRETEAKLRELIMAHYPDHTIIGEEWGTNARASSWQWIIDPIDGTKSFISGFPVYCTLIALMYKNITVVSVIDMPQLNERFSAQLHGDAHFNGKKIVCKKNTDITKAICYSTDPSMFTAIQMQRIQQLQQRIGLQRYSGDGYLYAMLAAGWIDLVVEADMKPYDYLPLVRIVEQAGGVITDWAGHPLTMQSNGEILAAANLELHQQALKLLSAS